MVSDPTAGREQSGKETCKRCRHHKRPAGLAALCAGVQAQPRRRRRHLRGACRVLPPGERDADCGGSPGPPSSKGSGSSSDGGSGGSSSGAAVPRCPQVKQRRTAHGRPPGHGHRILTSVRGSAARGQTEVTCLVEPRRRSQVSRGGQRRWGRAGSHPGRGAMAGAPCRARSSIRVPGRGHGSSAPRQRPAPRDCRGWWKERGGDTPLKY